jgi:hypothetical protein
LFTGRADEVFPVSPDEHGLFNPHSSAASGGGDYWPHEMIGILVTQIRVVSFRNTTNIQTTT